MNVKIRLAERQDVAAMLQIYAPFIKNTSISFEEEVPTEEAFWERVQAVLRKAPWLVCTFDGVVIAYAYAGSHRGRASYRWNRELSAYVHPDYRRRNIAGALYQVLFEGVVWQGYTNALAGIVLPNEASVKFHERVGFQLIGIYRRIGYKFGQYWDVGWWEKPLSPRELPPGNIKPLEELLASIHWKDIVQAAEDTIEITKDLKSDVI